MWVAGGTGGNTIYYSNDGRVWRPAIASNNPYDPDGIPFNGLNGGQCFCITYGGGMWVAGGVGGNTIYYSNDGRVWTPAIASNNPYDPNGIPFNGLMGGYCNCVTYGDVWVAGGITTFSINGTPSNTVYYSNDAITWTPCKTPVSALDPYGILFKGIARNTSFPGCYTVVYRNNIWVAGGGTLYVDSINTIYYSNNPADLWYPCTGSSSILDICGIPFAGFDAGSCETIEYANGIWVFGGGNVNVSHCSLYYGSTPSGLLIPCTTSITTLDPEGFPFDGGSTINNLTGTNVVTYANNIWLCGGGGEVNPLTNTAYYSTDGKFWTPCTTPITASNPYGILFYSGNNSKGCTSFAYNSGIWVACGGSSSIVLYYSNDGKTWQLGKASANNLFIEGNTVKYGNIWVTGGVM